MVAGRTLVFSALAGLLLLAAPDHRPALAQGTGVPDYEGEFFTDLTHRIPTRQKVEIGRVLRVAGQASSIHPMLVVIDRFADYPSMPQNERDFATRLANEWRVGEATTHRGVLVLFSIGDRKYFAARSNVEQSVTDQITAGFRGRVTDELRAGNVGNAMRMAADSIAEALPASSGSPAARTGAPVPGHGTHTITRTVREHRGYGGYGGYGDHASTGGRSSSSGGFGVIGLLVLVFVVVIFGSLLGGISRGYGPSSPGYSTYGSWGGGGGPGFWTGMFTGGLLGWLFSGHSSGWGSGWSSGPGWGSGWDSGSSGSSWTETTTTETWSDGGSSSSSSSSDSSSSSYDTFGGGNYDGGGSGGSW